MSSSSSSSSVHWKKAKRLNSLKKKIGELTVLCDIEGFMIIEGEDGEVYKWPEDEQKFQSLVVKYERGPASKKNKTFEFTTADDVGEGGPSVTEGQTELETQGTAGNKRNAPRKKRRVVDNETAATVEDDGSGPSRVKKQKVVEESEVVSAAADDPSLNAVVLQKLLARINAERAALDDRIDFLQQKDWRELTTGGETETDYGIEEDSLRRRPIHFFRFL